MYSVYFRKRLSEAKPPFDIPRFNIQYSAVRCSGHPKFHEVWVFHRRRKTFSF